MHGVHPWIRKCMFKVQTTSMECSNRNVRHRVGVSHLWHAGGYSVLSRLNISCDWEWIESMTWSIDDVTQQTKGFSTNSGKKLFNKQGKLFNKQRKLLNKQRKSYSTNKASYSTNKESCSTNSQNTQCDIKVLSSLRVRRTGGRDKPGARARQGREHARGASSPSLMHS